MSFIFLRNRVTGGAAFSPASLFASGEDGAWYEPSTTTAFRSTTDLTPCTYGDACGFLLDLSQGAGYSGGSFTGLGSELVTNGTFDTDVSGFLSEASTSISWSGGVLEAISTSAGSSYVYQNITTEVGKSYLLECDFNDGGNILAAFNGANLSGSVLAANTSANSSKSLIFVAQSTSSSVGARPTSAKTWTMDNISVRELPGNHATQSSEPARPILARVPSGGRRNLLERTEEFDDAVWVKNNTIIDNNSGDGYTDPNGGSSALKLIATANAGYVRQQETSISTVNTSAIFSLIDGSFQSSLAGSYDSINSTNEGNGWWRFECTKNGATLSVFAKAGEWDYIGIQMYLTNIYFYPVQTSTSAGTADGTSGVYIWGAQFEVGSSATAYQKVVDQYDITEAGVTSLEYLAFDGADDSFVILGSQAWYDQYIGSIVIAASTDSTASQDVVSNRGVDSGGAKGKYALSIRNNGVNWTYDNLVVGSGAATSTASPINTPYVFYGSGDGTNVSSSINSGSVTTVADTFTARNLDAYIGQDGNSATYFSGRIYGIVLTNDVLTAQEISDTESYVANLSGVTL